MSDPNRPVTDARKEEVRARLNAATPGEWKAWKVPAPDNYWTVRAVYTDEKDRRTTTWPAVCNAGAQPNEANAAFFANAKTDISDLLASLDSANATIAGMREAWLAPTEHIEMDMERRGGRPVLAKTGFMLGTVLAELSSRGNLNEVIDDYGLDRAVVLGALADLAYALNEIWWDRLHPELAAIRALTTPTETT